ncbi:hypothetical protein KP003_16370 [Geomonas nitrogeniifigens]|uniref:alginate O-acetyltransferase AlgX-related protein n=1 Tax=Geomonas diazotrophica TaxID=2843197 RepID=UPI001C2C6973|nr:hypothetical protein [Geomonas nitrogeniifigens]QXE85916.1 hypothetical protein KP003_16370 [Geomonas nitrogeniifigens]
MTKSLKCLYTAVMLFAAFVVVGGKFPAVGRLFLPKEPTAYILGDQYRMCDLDRFREEIPAGKPSAAATLEEADVLTLGDSFFNSALASDIFANELGRRLGGKVHNLATKEFFEPQSYPLSYLQHIGYRGDRKRILVLETVERSALERSGTYNGAGAAAGNELDALAFKVLKNNDVEYFFKHNVMVGPLESRLKNFRFKYLNIVDKSIGAYSLNPNMLFYQRDIEFSRVKKTDAVVVAAARDIAKLSATLKERYNIDLVYMVIPDKYSVYRGLVKGAPSYDRFIPRLCSRLTEFGVKNIDVYTLYERYNRPGIPPLYFASDTHYTAHGKAVLAEATANMLRSTLPARGDGMSTIASSGEGGR